MSTPDTESLDVERIREDFPILQREFDGKQVVYLDSAATAQTPDPVVDAIAEYYRKTNANVHRGIHHLSQEASIAYEEVHDRLAEFVGASGGREELIFTKNTTESENLVAYAWGLNELGPDDAVVLTEMEHHASLVTWQQIAKKTGAELRYVQVAEDGTLDMEHATEVIDDDVAIASVVHISNTLGTVVPVAELADLVHEHDGLFFVDGAQAVPTRPVDVEAIDADFYSFSGHKMLGPTGIGGLYGKQHLLEEMEPFNYGGGMIRSVSFEDAEWNDLPWKFEAGTPVIAQGIALAEAADYLDDIGMERIRRHEEALAAEAYDRLEAIDEVTVLGPAPGDDARAGLLSFVVDGLHAHDLASIMNDHAVAVRAGDHCTQPLHDKLGIPASTRASFYVYNSVEEIDPLVAGVEDAVELFA
ncbi:MAG TPA: SufS family cysteine desulfurase [Natrialbaceae archaeon]|nr:SufS family cysteine desulfurase [Natrialbaceae archaeon]